MDKVTTRPVKPDDEPFLLRLYADNRRREREQTTWTDQEWDEFILFQYNAQYRDYMARYPDAQNDIILYGESPVGRIWIGRDDEEIRLLDITIHSLHQSKGIGSFLIRGLQAEATESKRALRHMVAADNLAATRLYERLGFKFVYTQHLHNLMEWLPTS